MKNDIGYYKVGDRLFGNKYDAVIYAQSKNQNITWNFFSEIFSKVDWTTEPELSLIDLYRIRAKQIREKYDYVIVLCSGGSDSNNVVRTFLDNNIHLDEVIGIAPMSGLSNWNFNINNFNEDNTISETKFAMFPLFHEVANRNNKVKITVYDYFYDALQKKDEQWTYESCGNINTLVTNHLTLGDISKFSHIDSLLQNGKRIALVYGTDKPVIRIGDSGDMYFVFADAGINYLGVPESREYPNLDRVLFYWSPELPELLVKQSHVVAKAAHLPENKHILETLKPSQNLQMASGTFEDTIFNSHKTNNPIISKDEIFKQYITNGRLNTNLEKFTNKTIYQRLIIPFIYPTTYTKNLFQCQKVDSDLGFFTRDQDWVHILHKNTKISDMIISGTKLLYDSVSPRYLNTKGSGFVNFFNMYKFGSTKMFNMQ